MSKIKKFFSISLIFVMVLSSIPMSSFAEEWIAHLDNEIYYRPCTNADSSRYYQAFETDYYSVLNDIQEKLLNKEDSITIYYATQDSKYAYEYSEGSEDEVKNCDRVSQSFVDNIMNDIFKYNPLNNIKLGDYLEHSFYGYSYSYRYYPSAADQYYNSTISSQYYPFMVTISNIKYYDSKVEETAIENFAQSFSNQYINAEDSDYQKVKTIYDFVVANAEYDWDVSQGKYSKDSDRYIHSHSAYGALFGNRYLSKGDISVDISYKETISGEKVIKTDGQGLSVCEGYSKLFYYLCMYNGIECHIVDGDYSKESGHASDPHQWNYVLLKDYNDLSSCWYSIDTTFASQNSYLSIDHICYDYFLKGSNNIFFSESKHQQVENTLSFIVNEEDYDFESVTIDSSLVSSTNLYVCKTNDDGKVSYYKIVFDNLSAEDNSNKYHIYQVSITDNNKNIVLSEAVTFDYSGKKESYSLYIPYLIPGGEYGNAITQTLDSGRYSQTIQGKNNTSLVWDFVIHPHDITKESTANIMQVNIGDQSQKVSSINPEMSINYSGANYFAQSVMDISISDGNGNKLVEGRDFERSATNIKGENISSIVDIGSYYIILDFKGNYTGNIKIKFIVDKYDLSKTNQSEGSVISYYPKAMLNSNNYADFDSYVLTYTKKTSMNGLDLYKDVDYSAVVDSSSASSGYVYILLTGLSSSQKIVSGTQTQIKYPILKYDISKSNLNGAPISTNPSYTYTGSEIKPSKDELVNVNSLLEYGKDYKIVSYSSNVSVGTAYVTIEGIGCCTGTATLYYNIKQSQNSSNTSPSGTTTIITQAAYNRDGSIVVKNTQTGEIVSSKIIKKISSVKLSSSSYTYDGKVKKPGVVVKDSLGNTISSTNYSISYASGRKNVGKYKVVISFKGNYGGTYTTYFKINPPKTSVTSLTGLTKSFNIKWSKKSSQVTGYQIQYSLNSNMSSSKSIKVTSYKTVSKTIKNLKSKKKYYVRIRTYKNVGSYVYYSSWSTKKYIKTK